MELIEFFHPPLNDKHNFNKLPECNLGLTPDEEIERFFRLRVQQKLIEMELDALKPNIVTRCEQTDGTIRHNLGTIKAQLYKSWTYSEEIELLKLRLKTKKAEEERNGYAVIKTAHVSPIARVNAEAFSEELAAFMGSLQVEGDEEGLAQGA